MRRTETPYRDPSTFSGTVIGDYLCRLGGPSGTPEDLLDSAHDPDLGTVPIRLGILERLRSSGRRGPISRVSSGLSSGPDPVSEGQRFLTRRSMGLRYMPPHWPPKPPQCRPVWQSHGVYGLGLLAILLLRKVAFGGHTQCKGSDKASKCCSICSGVVAAQNVGPKGSFDFACSDQQTVAMQESLR